MKFTEYLELNFAPTLSRHCIAYEEMKRCLYEAAGKRLQDSSSCAVHSNAALSSSSPPIDEEFFQFCEAELVKVNAFLRIKSEEISARIDRLKQEMDHTESLASQRPIAWINPIYLKQSKQTSEQTSQKRSKIDDERNSASSCHEHFELQPTTGAKMEDQPINVECLKGELEEIYFTLVTLKNYQTLNAIGFSKILQKYDSIFQTRRGTDWRIQCVDTAWFHVCPWIDQRMAEIERLHMKIVDGNDDQQGIRQYRVMLLPPKHSSTVNVRLKLYLTLLCFLIPLIFITAFLLFGPHSSKSLNWRAGVHLYRSSFLIFIHLILFGINVYHWSKHGINYAAIFNLDPHHHLTYDQFFEIGCFLLILWCLSFFIFLITFYFDAYPFAQPVIFIGILLLFLFNPIRILYSSSRHWLIKRLSHIIVAPWVPVSFGDFWVANQLSSLELVFFDVEFFVCFYANRSNWSSSAPTSVFFCSSWSQIAFQIILKILPAWFRCAQCLRRYRDTKFAFPDLVNAAKYASGFLVSITNALRRAKNFDYHHHKLENPFLYLWVVFSLISSTWKIVWDIRIAWGLFDRNPGENKYLRSHLLHRRKIYYYMAMIADVLLRYLWMINIFIHFESLSAEYSDLLGFSLGFAEVFRRIMWNFFRLENEQLNNVRKCRRLQESALKNDKWSV